MCSPSSDVIHLVTDSTSDIPPSDAETLGVSVVPLVVRFGTEQYRDGVDIDADGFYAKLEHTDVHPTTSQPSPEVFAALYRTLLANPDDHVVGLHISSKLSGTLQSAHLAAQDFDASRVHLDDTESVSGGLQLLVRAALDDIRAGDDAPTVARAGDARDACGAAAQASFNDVWAHGSARLDANGFGSHFESLIVHQASQTTVTASPPSPGPPPRERAT